MIISIEIMINNNLIYVDTNRLCILYNGVTIPITEEDINKLLDMIVLWDKEMVDSKIIDGESCVIKLNTNEGTTVYNFRGKTPDNYQEYKKVLGGLIWKAH